jgi:hypothetical protein
MINKFHLWIAFVFLPIVFVVTTHAAERHWLHYRTGQNVRQILGNIGSQQIEVNTNKPAGVELPQFEMSNPLFGKWLTPMVKSGWIWIALDSSEKGKSYDRLFIDSNGDGNLKDETAVMASRKEANRSSFGPVKVLFEVENEPAAYHLNFEFSSYNKRNTLSVTSGAWYEGDITIGSQIKHLVLIDQNANGTFNDTSGNINKCDRILIGLNDKLQTHYAGKEIIIDAAIYKTNIAKDGSFIELNSMENITYGTIRLPETINRLSVKQGDRLFTVKPDNGISQLPTGKYRIQLWKTELKDKKGNNWLLIGQDFSSKGDFDVKDNNEVTLSIGEPVTCNLQIKKSGSTYTFNQVLTGRLGENIKMTCNGSQPDAPMLNIKNADGSYDRMYRFQYG